MIAWWVWIIAAIVIAYLIGTVIAFYHDTKGMINLWVESGAIVLMHLILLLVPFVMVKKEFRKLKRWMK